MPVKWPRSTSDTYLHRALITISGSAQAVRSGRASLRDPAQHRHVVGGAGCDKNAATLGIGSNNCLIWPSLPLNRRPAGRLEKDTLDANRSILTTLLVSRGVHL